MITTNNTQKQTKSRKKLKEKGKIQDSNGNHLETTELITSSDPRFSNTSLLTKSFFCFTTQHVLLIYLQSHCPLCKTKCYIHAILQPNAQTFIFHNFFCFRLQQFFRTTRFRWLMNTHISLLPKTILCSLFMVTYIYFLQFNLVSNSKSSHNLPYGYNGHQRSSIAFKRSPLLQLTVKHKHF